MTDDEKGILIHFLENLDDYAPDMDAEKIKRMGFDEEGNTDNPFKAHSILRRYKKNAAKEKKLTKDQRKMFNRVSEILLATPEAQEEIATRAWHNKIIGRHRNKQ